MQGRSIRKRGKMFSREEITRKALTNGWPPHLIPILITHIEKEHPELISDGKPAVNESRITNPRTTPHASNVKRNRR